MATLDFKSEPLELLKARYPKAIEKVWKMPEIATGNRPGLHREHIFDFASGVRLLISRDDFTPMDGEVVHVSASFEFDPPVTIEAMMSKVTDHFRQLGGEGRLDFLGFSSVVGGKGIPHWLVRNAENEVHRNRD